ncbi:MAG: LytTR family DNA-binding domain-containing protein [Bacteroidota bacterium]
MKRLSCIIIEDEPLAAEVLEDYVGSMPQLELVATCPDAIYALELLQQRSIDLMFLDIHLPKLKGLDFLSTLPHPPQVILTTAYHQYALKGYEFDVVDYLLKPISFARFVKAINKLAAAPNPQQPVAPPASASRHLFVKVNKRQVKVILGDILYIESLKEYAHIHTASETIVTKAQLTELEKRFQDNNLLRVHRSYLVAKDKLTAFSSTEVEIKEVKIPIGRSYKQQVLGVLEVL